MKDTEKYVRVADQPELKYLAVLITVDQLKAVFQGDSGVVLEIDRTVWNDSGRPAAVSITVAGLI